MKKILLLGDSLINCSNLNKNKRWIRLLNKHTDYRILNHAIDGITTEDLLRQKKIFKKSNSTDFLIISIGTNDSVYWQSNKGEPRVKQYKFKNNLENLFNYYKSLSFKKIMIIIPHFFLKNNIEVNNRTHNQNIIFYPLKKIFILVMFKKY